MASRTSAEVPGKTKLRTAKAEYNGRLEAAQADVPGRLTADDRAAKMGGEDSPLNSATVALVTRDLECRLHAAHFIQFKSRLNRWMNYEDDEDPGSLSVQLTTDRREAQSSRARAPSRRVAQDGRDNTRAPVHQKLSSPPAGSPSQTRPPSQSKFWCSDLPAISTRSLHRRASRRRRASLSPSLSIVKMRL
jgi:hypothetical protein